MKRRIAIIMSLLIGGAIINIAVAWGITCSGREHRALADNHFLEMGWYGDAFITTSTVRRYHIEATQFHKSPTGLYLPNGRAEIFQELPKWSRIRPGALVRIPDGNWARGIVDLYHEEAAGWPLLTVRYWRTARDNGRFGYDTVSSFGMFTVPWSEASWSIRHFPCWPIWPGFIINTLFYAMILWLLFATPFTARRMIRRRRGKCEKCAYPIGTSDVCTECGAAVAMKKKD